MGTASIRLTAEERRALQAMSRSKGVMPSARTRALVVLMSGAGRSGSEIAGMLGVSLRMVRSVRARWRRRAFDGLQDAPRPGRPPRADAAYIRRMVSAVQKDPREFGFAFTRWTAPRLVEYLHGETGVRVTPEWLTELLHTHGFAWRRTKRTLRNLQDRAEVERARKRLRRLKRGLSSRGPPTSSGSGTAFASTCSP